MSTRTPTEIAPVTKSIVVAKPVGQAFRLFTDGMGDWWPLESHSLGQSKDGKCGIEGRVGGAVWEETTAGVRHVWGTILAWEPPARLVFTWHPGREASLAQEVEMGFAAVDGGTRVTLEHRGWEVLGPAAEETRGGYVTGWDEVFVRRFGDRCRGA